ncbi:MAG: hypothetical protein Q8881_03945, partial [Sweet potato little leaf phytoplasma]|nr:hypothetical protein [Sweet potato little leaf phytoplasma]
MLVVGYERDELGFEKFKIKNSGGTTWGNLDYNNVKATMGLFKEFFYVHLDDVSMFYNYANSFLFNFFFICVCIYGLEVETAVLNSCVGGANARPFVTYHNTLAANFYLRIATEISLK